ncbi:MAG TPA: histidine kinase [Xanthobacteraceae bacterium]|nr:histidine kinase [Xanthobacteraceae bacterium]
MPSLFRFLAVVAVLVGLSYGLIYALATLVEPTPREMTITIPRDVLMKPR